jgi:hypothetical protein
MFNALYYRLSFDIKQHVSFNLFKAKAGTSAATPLDRPLLSAKMAGAEQICFRP